MPQGTAEILWKAINTKATSSVCGMLFKGLDISGKRRVLDYMHKLTVEEGDVVIAQGDQGNAFFIVEEGDFDIFVRADKTSESSEQQKKQHNYNTPSADDDGDGDDSGFGRLCASHTVRSTAKVFRNAGGWLAWS